MEEVSNDGVAETQELATPETETQQEAAPEENVQRENKNDRNWRELRRAKDEFERKAKMQEELIQQLMMNQRQAQPVADPEEDLINEIAKEEYVPGVKVAKGLKKLEEKFEKKVQEIESKYRTNHQNSLLQDVKREYADFEDVVTPETLDLIEETNPRLAASLAKTMKEDPYSFAIQSYEYIKSKGLAKSQTQSKRAVETEKKIEQNKKTVQSPQAYDKRPMAKAFQLTEDMKKELANEMYSYANQAGMGY